MSGEQKRKTMAEHKAQLAQEYGVEGHPKLDTLYNLAWDYGHAYGFREVEIHFSQMLPLIQ